MVSINLANSFSITAVAVAFTFAYVFSCAADNRSLTGASGSSTTGISVTSLTAYSKTTISRLTPTRFARRDATCRRVALQRPILISHFPTVKSSPRRLLANILILLCQIQTNGCSHEQHHEHHQTQPQGGLFSSWSDTRVYNWLSHARSFVCNSLPQAYRVFQRKVKPRVLEE